MLRDVGILRETSILGDHMRENYTAGEEKRLRDAVARGEIPRCPRCGGLLEQAPIPPRRDVAYVRDRVVLQCVSCGRKAVVDRR